MLRLRVHLPLTEGAHVLALAEGGGVPSPSGSPRIVRGFILSRARRSSVGLVLPYGTSVTCNITP